MNNFLVVCIFCEHLMRMAVSTMYTQFHSQRNFIGNAALSNKEYCNYGKFVFHCISVLKGLSQPPGGERLLPLLRQVIQVHVDAASDIFIVLLIIPKTISGLIWRHILMKCL